MIFEGTDAKIDDPELLSKKKNLTMRATPLAILNALQQKWPEGGSMIKNSKCWETKDQATYRQIWHYSAGIEELGIHVEAADFSKQKARQLAALKFLKKFFPLGFTWNKVVDVIFDKKGIEIEEILVQKNKILLNLQ